MILFLSDIHLGRGDPAEERKIEAGLIECLLAHEAEAERLYLLGDVFDQFIEYRHLAPKGFARLQGLLARWSDRGIPITYLVGNHDLWHRDYFEQELGVRVLFDPTTELLFGRDVYMAHGDGLDPKAYIYNRLRPLLRHQVPIWLYTRLLPGDAGFALARKVKHLTGRNEVNPAAVQALREHARLILTETSAEMVVMGHTHRPELTAWPEGAYLNTGYWRTSQTFGSLEQGRLRLLHWNGSCTEERKCLCLSV